MCAGLRPQQSHFNPRSPWGERLTTLAVVAEGFNISIHAPRGGSDQSFYCFLQIALGISIHAPRGGSDLFHQLKETIEKLFQSTLPVGGATKSLKYATKNFLFQSTLPVGGATLHSLQRQLCSIYFNPRSPWGERL